MNAQKTNRQEELPRILIGIDIEVHDWLDGEERWCKGGWILDQMPPKATYGIPTRELAKRARQPLNGGLKSTIQLLTSKPSHWLARWVEDRASRLKQCS